MLLLAMIVLLAVAVRVVAMQGESFWWDEYTSLTHLDQPTLGEFLWWNTSLDPATLPAYYILEYLWTRGVSGNPGSLRWLSVILSLPALLFMYGIGRRCFAPQAGLVAALCLALSPIHAYHSVSIRMYVLLITLAAASVYTLLRLRDTGGARWWAAHGAANFLLFWTHPFAALLVVVEGVAWLCLTWRTPRQWLGWGAFQAVLAVPTAIYLASVRFWGAESTSQWLRAPTFPQFLGDLFADDVIAATYQRRIITEVWEHVPGFLVVRPVFDALFIGGVALVLVVMAVRRVRGETLLLLLWLLLPATVLYVLTLTWRPCIFPRYTAHSALALYVLVGGAVSMLPRAGLRWLAAGVVVVLLGYQTALALPGAQSTNWQAASRHIRSVGRPTDLVAVLDGVDRDVFRYNHRPAGNPVTSAETGTTVARQAALMLSLATEDEPAACVWVAAAQPYFDTRPPEALAQDLQRAGLVYTHTRFPGIRPVYLFRTTAAKPQDAADIALSPEDKVAMGYLALTLVEAGQHDKALAILTLLQRGDAFSAVPYVNLAEALAGGEDMDIESRAAAVCDYVRATGYQHNQQYKFAARALEEAVAHDPELGVAWGELGLARALTGDRRGALQAFDRCLALEPPQLRIIFARVAQQVRNGRAIGLILGALEPTFKLLRQIEAGQPAGMHTLADEAIAADPGLGFPYVAKTYAYWRAGNEKAGLASLRTAAAKQPDLYRPWLEVARRYLSAGGSATAEAYMDTLRLTDAVPFPHFLREILEARVGAAAEASAD